ncbi:site-specific integrase [Ferruginibacter sp. SUN002]|uniref:site-specific integrase n=1 Tax=Ferruginibacter sp. SUN002 TaxID=2937789 RepID=UPI003D369C28
MARTNTGVRFVLKRPKEEVSTIKVIFCYDYTQLYYYEKKLSVPVKFWNKNAQRVKETRSFPEYAELNATLDSIESTILDCYRKYKNDFNCEPSVDLLRELIKIKRGTSVKPANKPLELFDFIEVFINDAKEGKYINLAKGTPVAKITIRTYQQTQKLLKSYVDHYGKIKFEDISTQFHKKFTYFLAKVYRSPETNAPLMINTIGKHLTNIKTFMSEAIERGLTKNQSFRNKSFKVIREDVDKIYLTDQEIKALEGLDLNDSPRLEKVRDMFIIGCHTALRISDLKRLTKQHIIKEDGELFIKIEMKKTGKPVTIPVNSTVKRLIKKYESSTGDYFPRAISDQRANDYIKEAAAMVEELKKEVIINTTEDGLRVSKSIPKYELITNHTARRSFATNSALKGMSYQFIMPITGHSTTKSFLRYIKIDGMNAAKMFTAEMKRLGKNNLKVV